MAGNLPSRLLLFVFLAPSVAFCQQNERLAKPLPDAPSLQTTTKAETLRAVLDTTRLPMDTLGSANRRPALRFDFGHFSTSEVRKQAADAAEPVPFLANRPLTFRTSTSDSFLGRVADAASGIVLTRDSDGNRKLNTPYLMRVLAVSVAHSAYRPYWRRSATQPISDFGSTVGSDAGMNVFHEFEPGILQLVKSHEPRFVSKIQAHGSPR